MKQVTSHFLLVGNDPELTALLSDSLQGDVITVHPAPSGDEILKILRDPQVDMILLGAGIMDLLRKLKGDQSRTNDSCHRAYHPRENPPEKACAFEWGAYGLVRQAV